MGTFRIACQTLTFGENQRERFAEVFGAVAAAGYHGVELGFRHVQDLAPTRLRELLAAHGLAAAAYHVGGNLLDADQAESEKCVLDSVLETAAVTGTTILHYSGLRHQDTEALRAELELLRESSRRAAAHGVQLLYHNHNWEFTGSPCIMDALLSDTDLELCPDLGWIAKAGRSPVEFLQAHAARVGSIHFKDFATLEDGLDTVELGAGVAGLSEAAAWARDNLDGLWIIAEQDKTGTTPEQSIAENARFLRQAFVGHLPATAQNDVRPTPGETTPCSSR
jgi:sugar phosphate isomerase/epimerase